MCEVTYDICGNVTADVWLHILFVYLFIVYGGVRVKTRGQLVGIDSLLPPEAQVMSLVQQVEIDTFTCANCCSSRGRMLPSTYVGQLRIACNSSLGDLMPSSCLCDYLYT